MGKMKDVVINWDEMIEKNLYKDRFNIGPPVDYREEHVPVPNIMMQDYLEKQRMLQMLTNATKIPSQDWKSIINIKDMTV